MCFQAQKQTKTKTYKVKKTTNLFNDMDFRKVVMSELLKMTMTTNKSTSDSKYQENKM